MVGAGTSRRPRVPCAVRLCWQAAGRGLKACEITGSFRFDLFGTRSAPLISFFNSFVVQGGLCPGASPPYPGYCLFFLFVCSLLCFNIFIVSVKIPFGFAGAHRVVVLPPPHIAPERLVRLSRGFAASARGQTSPPPPSCSGGARGGSPLRHRGTAKPFGQIPASETKRKCKSCAPAGFVVLPAPLRLGEEEGPDPAPAPPRHGGGEPAAASPTPPWQRCI